MASAPPLGRLLAVDDRLVQLHQPDVVLLDIRMPGMTGIDVLQQMRRRSSLRRGALDYVQKPFDFEILHRCVAAATTYRGRPA